MQTRGRIAWRRNLVITVVLAVLVLLLQLLFRAGFPLALLSAAVAVVVALGVLAVSDRFSHR